MALAQQRMGACGLARHVIIPPWLARTLVVPTHQINALVLLLLCLLFLFLIRSTALTTTAKIVPALKDVLGLALFVIMLRLRARIMDAQILRLNVAVALVMSNALPVEDVMQARVLPVREIEVAIITLIA